MRGPGNMALVIAAVISATAALADTNPQTSDKTKAPSAKGEAASQSPARKTPTAGGVVIFIDPATGKIRQPDAAEIERLVSPLETAKPVVTAPLATFVPPGGGVGVVLDESFESYMVVTKKPDGKVATECVTGERRAARAVAPGEVTAKTSSGAEATHAH